MKTIVKVLATTLIAAGAAVGGSLAQARDINVGVSIGGEFQPGVYGQVNVNTMPAYVVYQQPAVIVQQPVYYAVPARPVYVQPYYRDYRRCDHHRGHGHGHRHHHH